MNICAGSLLSAIILFDARPTMAADVSGMALWKARWYAQTNDDLAQPRPQNPCSMQAWVSVASPGLATAVRLSLPNQTLLDLIYNDTSVDGVRFELNSWFASKTNLDQSYPAGNYVLRGTAVHDGSWASLVPLPSDQYPPVPHLRNFGFAQAVNPSATLTLSWDPYVGGTTNDHVQFEIVRTNGATLYRSGRLWDTNRLYATNSILTLPANLIAAGQAYTARLSFWKVIWAPTNYYPSGDVAAAYVSQTEFTIRGRSSQPVMVQQPRSQAVRQGATISLSCAAIADVSPAYQWYKGNVALTNSARIGGTTSSMLTITSFQDSDAGGYWVMATNAFGTANSTIAWLYETPPTLAISSLAQGYRTTNTTLHLIGRSADDIGVVKVLCRINGGAWQTASGTIAWMADFSLAPGTNWVEAYAVDTSGSVSPTNLLQVCRIVYAPLTLVVNGPGRVTPNLTNRWLEAGREYRLTATPDATGFFSNWVRGAGQVVTNNPNLRFLMETGLTLTANFVPNPFAQLKGDYVGLFLPPEDQTNALGILKVTVTNAGLFKLKVTDKGVYSGQLSYRGNVLPVAGAFAADRSVAFNLARAGQAALQVALWFTNGSNAIEGTVGEGATWWAKAALRRTGTGTSNPFSGKYTLAANGGISDGFTNQVSAIAAVTVTSAGAVTWSGNVADGSLLGGAAMLTTNGDWAVYQSLYGGQGMVVGWLAGQDAVNQTSNSFLFWQKNALPFTSPYASTYPNGFLTALPPNLARYVMPVAGHEATGWTNGIVTLVEGNLVGAAHSVITVRNNVFRIPIASGPAVKYLTLNRANGLFSGSFTHPATGRATLFKGILTQSGITNNIPADSVGQGYFLGTNAVGTVRLNY